MQTDPNKSRRNPQVVKTARDRDVVRMAKMIMANFTEVSKQTAHSLLEAGRKP